MVKLLGDGIIIDVECIKLPAPIPDKSHVYECYGRVFVINNTLDPRNIWCFNRRGRKLWEIEPSLSDRPYLSLVLDAAGRLSARDLEDDVYIVDINNGYIELPYGKRAISPENSNAMIRQRRKDRLNTEWGWYAIGAVVLSIAKLWTKKIKTENPYAPTRGVAESIPAARESRLSDYEIFRDHVFEKCALTQEGASELNARTQKRFSGHIEDTIDHPAQEKALSGGRRTYRGGDMNVVVIKNPGTMDGAAAFQPLDGRAYFEGLR